MTVVPFAIGYLHEREDPDVGSWLEPLELRFAQAVEAGEIDRPVEILVEHGYGLPGGSAHACQQAWQRLADHGVLAIVGPGNTDNAFAVKELAESQHLSTINWSGSERSRSQYNFHYQVGSLYDEGPLLAAAIAATGAARVAVVRDRSPIGDEYWQYFNEAAAEHGLTVASDQKISPVASTLRAEVDRAAVSNADAFVYLGFGGVLPVLWSARREADWQAPMFTNTAGLHWYVMPDEARALGEGTIYVDMFDERNRVTQAMLDALAARSGERPLGPLAPAMYDMATLVVKALRFATVHTREGVNEGFERVHQVPAALGGAGTVMGFGPWERTALKGPDYLLLRVMGADATHPHGG